MHSLAKSIHISSNAGTGTDNNFVERHFAFSTLYIETCTEGVLPGDFDKN